MNLPRRPLAFAAAGLAALLLAGIAQGCGSSSKRAPGGDQPTPPPATAIVASPRLGYCPAEIGEAICQFAAEAQGWVQSADVDHLVTGAGSAAATQRESLRAAMRATFGTASPGAAELRSIACPLVAGAPPAPECASFALTFATVTEKEVDAGPEGILVLGFTVGSSGPVFDGPGVPDGPGRIYVMTGPNANGCALPGVEATGGCLGFRVFPVEVLASGQTPPPPPGADETIGGIRVKPLEVGKNTNLPQGLVVFLSPALYASDSNPVLLWRVYRDPAGNIQRDDVFESLRERLGEPGITGWAGDERMGELFVTTCPAERCRATGVGGWSGEFDVYHSVDGGMTWSADGHVAAMTSPEAVTSGSVVMGEFLGWGDDDAPRYRFFSFPSGSSIQPPAANTMPRLVPGAGVVWEPTRRPTQQFGVEPSFDASGKVIAVPSIGTNMQVHLLGKGGDGTLSVAWDYIPDRPADPHALTHYVGRVDKQGELTAIYSSGVLLSWLGPYPAGSNLLIGNASLPPGATSEVPFDVPAVLIALETGELLPLRELEAGLEKYQQPLVARVVAGPIVRVDSSGDCLNVRESPSVQARSLGCYRDGVLLGDGGESRNVQGIAWRLVLTPAGEAGWASGEFLVLPS